MTKKKAKEIQEYDIFQCRACDDKPEFERKEVFPHLASVHGVESPEGTRRMISHMDADKYYSGEYLWTFGSVEVYEAYQRKRSKQDMAMWK